MACSAQRGEARSGEKALQCSSAATGCSVHSVRSVHSVQAAHQKVFVGSNEMSQGVLSDGNEVLELIGVAELGLLRLVVVGHVFRLEHH